MLCFWCGVSLIAQNAKPKLSIKDRLNWKEANDQFAIQDYRGALAYFEELLQAHPNWSTLNFNIGVCLFDGKKNKLESEPYFKKALDIPKSNMYLGQIMHLKLNFDSALYYYNIYLNDPSESKDIRIIEQLRANTNFAKEHLKDITNDTLVDVPYLNSKFDEYAPVLSSDGKTLFFTSRRSGGEKNSTDQTGRFFEDIYISTLNDSGYWVEPKKVFSSPHDLHEATAGLSPDGKKLVVFRTDKNYITGNLFYTSKEVDQWGKLHKFENGINSSYIESSMSFSLDQKTIYFSSDRPGGFGGKDIYRIRQMGDGSWSKPFNLGPLINTAFDDDAPFIHPNGITLFFCSKGHQNLGGYDIFRSELNLEEDTWSRAKNLKSPLNSVYDDVFFSISSDGEQAFFSSERSYGLGGQDIFKINLKQKPIPYFIGYVFDAETNHPIKATLKVTKTNGDIQGIYKSSKKTGKYIFVLDYKQTYKVEITHPKYSTYSKSITIEDDKPFEGTFKLFKK